MANQILPITELAKTGLVIDTPPVALAQNAFTDVKNVRFRDGAVSKMQGEVLLNDIVDDLTVSGEEFGKVRYLAFWPNPNLAPLEGYYLFVVDYVRNNITVGQKVYIQDHTGTKVDLTPSGLNSGDGFSYTSSGWQHDLFSGGFTFILNNGIDKPHYILDESGNTDINNLVLAELPGWDSYYTTQGIHEDTWSTAQSTAFDLAQLIDFTVNYIEITGTNTKTVKVGSPAGTGTPNASNFVPGALPSTLPTVTGNQFEIYTDTATNTTVCVVGGLSAGDDITVTVKSRNPVNVRAGIVRSFGDLLVAGDLTEVDSTDNTKIIRRLSGVVRTSDLAIPGAIPNNWNPFEAGVSTADEFTLSETNIIQDMQSLQGNLYIYTTGSIHVMTLTGNENAPVAFGPVTDTYGVVSSNIITEYDGKHFVVGSNDIYLFAGHPGDIVSVSDTRVRNYFFDNLNPIHEQQAFTLLNQAQNEIWINYPTINSLAGECDEALIWNYRENTWTIRELNNVTSGDVAPIRGGGIPSATLTITGSSGNAGYTNTGKREVQAITVNGDTPRVHIGTKVIKDIDVGTFTSFTTDVKEVVDINVTGDTGPNVEESVETVTFPSSLTFSYDADGSSYADGGVTIKIIGDSSIGTTTVNAIQLLGTDYSEGDTITMTNIVEALKDYINANSALANWTATASTNVLTLTSDVPGERSFTSGTITKEGGTPDTLTFATTTAGVGVYGINAANSPAIRMRVQASAASGVHAAIDEYITLTKNLTATTDIRDDIVTKLSALADFNGTSSAIYSVSTNGNDVRLISTSGGDHSAITVSFDTISGGTVYTETKFGGNLTATVTVDTDGVDNGIPDIDLQINYPNGDTDTITITGTHTPTTVATQIRNTINADSNWSTLTTTATNVRTKAAAVGVQSTNFSITITSTGTLPTGFSASTFTYSENRAGRDAASTTDRITLTPPSGHGSAITVNFDDTSTWTAYDIDIPNTEEVTATEIATALETAWTQTSEWTLSRSGAVLTFTSADREAVTGEFEITVTQGDTRTGTAVADLITDTDPADITVTDGANPVFSQLTRATVTINTVSGDLVVFDKHYGEGPGRLLDPTFTAAADDNTYGDTAYTNDTDYLNAYYDPDKDLTRTNTTEQAKDNGTVVDADNMLLDILTELSSRQSLILDPDSTSAPTTIDIKPSQFSSDAEYIKTWVPYSAGDTSTVAPSTTNLLASAEGVTVATTDPTYDTTGSSITSDFNIDRPWSSEQLNPNKLFPIFAQTELDSSDNRVNRIRAADISYTFDGDEYISYVERSQMFIMPDFTTEGLDTVALWADGGTITTVGGEPERATLRFRARATNYPGDKAFLTVAEDNTQTNSKANKLVVNDFVVASDYKIDLRIFGRFLNYRIDDGSLTNTAANDKAWDISGIQLDISKGGDR